MYCILYAYYTLYFIYFSAFESSVSLCSLSHSPPTAPALILSAQVDLTALPSPVIPESQLISEPNRSPCTAGTSLCPWDTERIDPKPNPAAPVVVFFLWKQQIKMSWSNLGSYSLPERWSWVFIPVLVSGTKGLQPPRELIAGNVGFVGSNSICGEPVNNIRDDERSHQLLTLK